MTSQLERWQGDFGQEYTDRNQIDWRTRVEGFRSLIPGGVASVFEVGVNKGHNLEALQEVGLLAYGCEPAAYPRAQAKKAGLRVCGCSVYSLGGHGKADLVLTSGVLIHVPPGKLDEALGQIYRLSRKWILAIEYDGDDQVVPYRGFGDMLWRRDYGQHFERATEAKVCSRWLDVPGFDGATCWLLKK